MIGDAIKLIPREFRPRFRACVALAFVKGLLNLVGFAVFIPVLLLFLQPDDVMSNPAVARVAELLGITGATGIMVLCCTAVLLVIVVKNLLLFLINRKQNMLYVELFKAYSENLFRYYMSRGLLYIKDRNTGTLTNNVCFATYSFVFNVLGPVVAVISEAMLVVMTVAIVAIVNVYVVLILLAFIVPLFGLYQRMFRNRLEDMGREEYYKRRNQIRIVQESMKGYAEITVNNAVDAIFSRYDRELDLHAGIKRRIEDSRGLTSGVLEVVVMVLLVLLVVAGRLVDAGGTSLVMMLGIFGLALVKIIGSARSIINNYTMIRTSAHTMEIVGEAPAEPETEARPACETRLEFRDSVEVSNLRFAYEGGREVISGLSLTIRKGETLGIRGESGSGKSTLFYLLLGLYKPDSGTITVDGRELAGDMVPVWQNTIGYVSQDVFISDSTIADNITMGGVCGPVDDQRLAYAVRMASLDRFVAGLPEGVGTRIGEGGSKLSGGLKQRIGIARALYKKADVLFFDEATSSLDSRTEQEIRESVRHLSQQIEGLTVVIIAHNESSLEDCGRIVDINDINNIDG